MRLLSCHVDNFGKLSDFSMDFLEGINVINASNAWGKSTLAAFLKAMFYGLESKKSAKTFDKERNIYRPWQGGSFGGELDFEIEGKKYRVSRSFGKTEKYDEFHLYDLSTNLECDDFSSELGLELFDLDSESFRKSIFIAQNDCASETSDGINAKLGNIGENASDINRFEQANKQLKLIMNQLTPDRVTGSIKRRKNLITQMKEEIRDLEAAKTGYEEISIKKQVMEGHLQELLSIRQNYAKALEIASEESRRQELLKQFDVLCQEATEKEQKVEAYKSIFPIEVPQQSVFDEQIQNLRAMEELHTSCLHETLTENEQTQWSMLEEMFREKRPSVESIDTAISTLTDAEQLKAELGKQESLQQLWKGKLEEVEDRVPPKESGIHHKIYLIAGAVITVISVIALVLGVMYLSKFSNMKLVLACGAISLIFGVLFLVVGYMQGKRFKKEFDMWEVMHTVDEREIQTELDKITQNISKIKANTTGVFQTISAFLQSYHVYCENDKFQEKLYELKTQLAEFDRLQEKSNSYMTFNNQYQERKLLLDQFATEYGFVFESDPMSEVRNFQNKAIEYELAKKACEDAFQKRDDFASAQDPSFWTKEIRCPYSLEELNVMIREADEKLDEIKLIKDQYQGQLDNLEKQLELKDEKNLELDELLEEQEIDQKKYQFITLTQEFLQKAKEQFIAKYMGPISKGFSKYYTMLTGEDNGEWMIDANITLKMKEWGELRDTKWLSAGYQDLVGVCMRLALVDAMYKQEKPFLILDDPFVNLDMEKVEAGNQLLLSVANEYQVIYFTCHDSRSPV